MYNKNKGIVLSVPVLLEGTVCLLWVYVSSEYIYTVGVHVLRVYSFCECTCPVSVFILWVYMSCESIHSVSVHVL